MQLFQLREPSNCVESPGLPISKSPQPHIFLGTLPSGDPYILHLSGSLSEGAIDAPSSERLLAGEFVKRRGDGAPMLVREMGWMDPSRRRRAALIHLDTSVGEGGKLILTGPHGAPELLDSEDRPEVARQWMPFKDAPGVFLLSEDVVDVSDGGVVSWKEGVEESGTPFLLISMFKGASFRVMRTGDLDGAPSEFTLYWDGFSLRTSITERRKRF